MLKPNALCVYCGHTPLHCLFSRAALLVSLATLLIIPAHCIVSASAPKPIWSSRGHAWKVIQHAYTTPPPPLKQRPDRMFTQKEIADYYTRTANAAGAIADMAKQFYTRYPDDVHAAKAREIYFNMLHAAVGLSSTSKIGELEAATALRIKDPKLDETARFQLSLRLLKSAVSGRQYAGDDAMRAELEKRALQLALAYPTHPEGVAYLLNLARAASPEKSSQLAREIMGITDDARIKSECSGLIARSAAVGRPFTLDLTKDNGGELHLSTLRGKVVLLLLWDSASSFSPKALWAVNQLNSTYHSRGLEVVGLNFDTDRTKADAVLEDLHLSATANLDIPAGSAFRDEFGIKTLPQCWIVDKKGVLRELKGERDPEGIVKKLLAE